MFKGVKHDLWCNSEICLNKDLVDDIKTTKKAFLYSKEYSEI